jgi:hypothetical protein
LTAPAIDGTLLFFNREPSTMSNLAIGAREGISMAARKKTAHKVETDVLLKSRRRCCICFGLKRDDNIKKGQIAHLDRDPGNNDPDNLGFLCVEHHPEYDGKFSQIKNFTIAEVKAFRDELYRTYDAWSNFHVFPAGLLQFLASITGPEEIAAGILKIGFQITAFPDYQVSLALTEGEVESEDGDTYVPLEYILSHLQSWGLLTYEVDEARLEKEGFFRCVVKQENPEFSALVYEKFKVLWERERASWPKS